MLDGKATLSELPALAILRVSNGALRGEALPQRIKIFNWGANPSIKGTFRAGEQTAQVLEANQRALGFERVAIDYNHCTVPGSPEYVKGQPPAIFGYGTVKVLSGDGIWLEDITWTPLGQAHARNFEDLSPALHPDAPGAEIDFVHSVALTTNGALHDVTFFSANNTTPNMSQPNSTPGSGNIITLAVMASALGLAASATEAEVVGKIKRLSALDALLKDDKIVILDSVAALDARLQKLEGADFGTRLGKIEEAGNHAIATLSANIDGRQVTITPNDLVALSARVEKVEETLRTGATAAADKERGELIARFSAEGRVPMSPVGKPYSDQELGQLDVTTLRILSVNTPVTVPLHARGKRPVEGSSAAGLKGLARTQAAFQEQYDGMGR